MKSYHQSLYLKRLNKKLQKDEGLTYEQAYEVIRRSLPHTIKEYHRKRPRKVRTAKGTKQIGKALLNAGVRNAYYKARKKRKRVRITLGRPKYSKLSWKAVMKK